MKPNLILILLMAINYSGKAQGNFQNLNFELANVAGLSPGNTIPFTNAFPGWSGLDPVYYDALSAGGPLQAINDSGSGVAPLQGIYSLYLAGGASSVNPVAISQMGVVPVNAKTLEIDAHAFGNGAFLVTLGGQTIVMVPLQTSANYTTYGGDISSFAGLSTTLTLTAPPVGINGSVLLDNLIFSSQSIPEPAVWTILLCGGAITAVARRKSKR